MQGLDRGLPPTALVKTMVDERMQPTVAQTIGNGGVRMAPRLVGKVLDPEGRSPSRRCQACRRNAGSWPIRPPG